jgi:hypothetical protein
MANKEVLEAICALNSKIPLAKRLLLKLLAALTQPSGCEYPETAHRCLQRYEPLTMKQVLRIGQIFERKNTCDSARL